jgi:hypothetical protein
MATIRFLLQEPYVPTKSRNLNQRETRLYVFVIFERNRVIKLKTQHKINPKDWNFNLQRMKGGTRLALLVNEDINRIKELILIRIMELNLLSKPMQFPTYRKELKKYGKTLEIPFGLSTFHG